MLMALAPFYLKFASAFDLSQTRQHTSDESNTTAPEKEGTSGYQEFVPELARTIAFFAIAMLFGCIADAIAEHITSRYYASAVDFESTPEGGFFAVWIAPVLTGGAWLLQSNAIASYRVSRKWFVDEMKHQAAKKFDVLESEIDRFPRVAVTGYFWATAPEESQAAVRSNYATQILSRGLTLATAFATGTWSWFICEAAPTEFKFLANLSSIAIGLACCWCLASLSFSMYLYSYDMVFRECYFRLASQRENGKPQEQVKLISRALPLGLRRWPSK